MSKRFALPYLVFTLLLLAAVSAQVLLAGLALFWKNSLWDVHVGLGHMAPLIALAMLILALVGRLPARLRSFTGLLFAAVILQTEVFAGLHQVSGLASAYHPFLAMLIFWGGTVVAGRSYALVKASGRAQPTVQAPRAWSDAECGPGLGVSC